MVEQALDIATWHPNVVVKLPSTRDGFRAMAPVAREGIPINQTLCFSVNQALLGAQAGVAYVSPFVGRLDDAGHRGMDVVADIVEVYRQHALPTQVLAASIRHPAALHRGGEGWGAHRHDAVQGADADDGPPPDRRGRCGLHPRLGACRRRGRPLRASRTTCRRHL